MTPIPSLCAALAAVAIAGLGLPPAAQAGVFTATAVGELQLLSAPIPGVTITYANAVVLNDGFASNAPRSYVDNDALLINEPTDGLLNNSLVVMGDALASDSVMATVEANLWTEGGIGIDNTTADAVELEFAYLVDLFAQVLAQASGSSTANAFARVEIFWDGDTIVDEIVAVALGALESDARNGSGSFTVRVPAGTMVNIGMFVDAGGDSSHVPEPASLPLVIAGIGLVGLLRRRGSAQALPR